MNYNTIIYIKFLNLKAFEKQAKPTAKQSHIFMCKTNLFESYPMPFVYSSLTIIGPILTYQAVQCQLSSGGDHTFHEVHHQFIGGSHVPHQWDSSIHVELSIWLVT